MADAKPAPEEHPEQVPEDIDPDYAEGLAWLHDRWGEEAPACPYCGTRFWVVGPPIRIQYANKEGVELILSRPLLRVSCQHCGNTILLTQDAADSSLGDTSELPE